MTTTERMAALAALGERLLQPTEKREAALHLAEIHNGWFTKANSRQMLEGIARDWLNENALRQWFSAYPKLAQAQSPRRIALILAGNIPAVGLHDVLTVFAAGHKALIKYSDKDKFLIPFVLGELAELYPASQAYFEAVERVQQPDAVIATGSDNSAVYFQQYFGKYPHIIRQNRHSVAILDGNESAEDLHLLGLDIFRYFGLGCRSVSKVYVPRGYDFNILMASLDNYKDINEHNKYRNNFDYNRSLYLLNQVPHFINDCILVLENAGLSSRIATLHYEYYDSVETLVPVLAAQQKDKIQCIASRLQIPHLQTVALGQTQNPQLWDYADGVDTMAFLTAD